jgi:hypothetical protein
MPELPGWDSLPAVSRYHSIAEIAGIIILAALVMAEIVAYQYGKRKDFLTEQQETAKERHHDGEMTRLQHDTALAKERAAQFEKEALDLHLKLRPLTSQRSLDEQQTAAVVSSLSKFPTVRVTIIPIWTTAEVTHLTNELANVLNVTLMTGGAPKYEGNLPPVIVQNLDNRFFSGMGDGVTIQYLRGDSPPEDFSKELLRLLSSAGITARTSETEKQKPGFVLLYIGAIPPN